MRLRGLRVDEGSLVDKGANPAARVVLFKRDESATEPEAPMSAMAVDKIGAKISADRLARLKTAAEALLAIIAEAETPPDAGTESGMPAEKRGTEVDVSTQVRKGALPAATMAKLPPEVASYIAELEGKLGVTTLAPDIFDKLPEEAKAHIAALEAKVQELTDAEATEDAAEGASPMDALLGQPQMKADATKVDIWKGIDPAVREQVEKAEREAAEAKAELAKARDQALTREYVAKAAQFRALPVKADEFGPVLKRLATSDAEAYAEVERVLRAADAAMTKSDLFREIGRGGAGAADSAWARIEAAASGLVGKSAGLTQEQAIARVLSDQPALYDEYLREQAR
jgi:hypothetical protein